MAEFSSLTELNLASTDLGMSSLKLVGCTPHTIRFSVHRRTQLVRPLTTDTRTRTHTPRGLGLPGLVKLNLSNTHLNDAHLVHVASTHLVSAGRPPPNGSLSLLLSAQILFISGSCTQSSPN